MKDQHVIFLPQMGANDEEATIVEWYKKDSDWVNKGEDLCCVETSKAAYDVEADSEGYLTTLAEEGDTVRIAKPLAVLSMQRMHREEVVEWLNKYLPTKELEQSEANFTKKALIIAQRLGIDISVVPPKDGKITEADVEEYAQGRWRIPEHGKDIVDDIYTKNKCEKLLIIGGGDGAVQLLDVLSKVPNQRAAMILDDNPELHGKSIMGVPIEGPISIESAAEMHHAGIFDAAIISVSTSIEFRERVFNEWTKENIPFANVIHPTCVMGANLSIGVGNVILALCHIGPCARIGNNNFLSTYTNIEHHNVLGNHCSFGPGVLTSSSVQIGDRARFGTGIFIEPHISIGSDCIISSGSILVNQIPSNSIVKSKSSYFIRDRKK